VVISYFVSSIPLGRKGKNMSNGVHSIPPSSLLNIDVELVSFKPVIDIIGDSKVLNDQGAVAAIEGATVTSK
jgi:FK506-binding protein 4/5